MDEALFKANGINGPPLTLIKSFLSNRFQRVVLNGQTSNWKEVLAGVPQGSILGPLFFLIFINDIPEGIQSNIKIFADDTSIFSVLKVVRAEMSHFQLPCAWNVRSNFFVFLSFLGCTC